MTYQSWRDSFSNRDWRKSQRQSMEKLPLFGPVNWNLDVQPGGIIVPPAVVGMESDT